MSEEMIITIFIGSILIISVLTIIVWTMIADLRIDMQTKKFLKEENKMKLKYYQWKIERDEKENQRYSKENRK